MVKRNYTFDGKVVLVTGAGRGLGRAFAEYLAGLGVKVVVNGLGSPDEDLPERCGVDITVERIRERQGVAEAFIRPVNEAQALIDYCVDTFGRLDAVVHAAGFVRDKSFAKMPQEDWQAVQAVHLESAFLLAKAAWPHFIEQQSGKLVFIGSAAGLYGNFGQANYAAAKMGLVGLTKTLALEGKRAGIVVNCVAPVGVTSMNRHLLTEEQCQQLAPGKVAPLVGWLCHERCDESGSVFEAAGGWFGKVHIARSAGAAVDNLTGAAGLAAIEAAWGDITDEENVQLIHSVGESMAKMA